MEKESLRYSYFLKEKRKEEEAKRPKKFKDEDDKYLKILIKDILPLMSIKDLVGCLVVKTCDDEGAILKGIPYGDAEYEVTIKKVPKES